MGILDRSWMFQIVNRVNQRVEDSFTLVIPPRAYKFDQRMRKNINKTFGNVFINKYGPDNPELTVSGFSGTSRALHTYNINGNDARRYNEREAFYEFRDRILHFEYDEDFAEKELHVFDLADEQSYRCELIKFSLDRSHETPFKYPYSIDLFVINRLNDKIPSRNSLLPEQSSNNDAATVDALSRAEDAQHDVAKAIGSESFDKGLTDGALESDNPDDSLLLDFASRGGSYRIERREVADIEIAFPEDEFSDAEIASIQAAIRRRAL